MPGISETTPTQRHRHAAVGDTAILTVEAASDRPVGPWQVEVIDLAARQGGEPCSTARLGRSTVGSGDTARLTITLLRKDHQYLCYVGLVSIQSDNRHLWPLIVITR